MYKTTQVEKIVILFSDSKQKLNLHVAPKFPEYIVCVYSENRAKGHQPVAPGSVTSAHDKKPDAHM